MAFTPDQLLLLNRSVARTQDEQIAKLYLRLYSYMIQDFRHKLDCLAAHTTLNTWANTHVHLVAPGTVAGAPPGVVLPVVGATLNTVLPQATVPLDTVALSLLMPGVAFDPNAPTDVPLPYKHRNPIGIVTDAGEPLSDTIARRPFSAVGA